MIIFYVKVLCLIKQIKQSTLVIYLFNIIKIVMRRKNKESEDIESHQNSSATSEQPQSKSFMNGGSSRLVSLSMPDIVIKKSETFKKQSYCVICFRNFTNFFRQHHCRICANAVCGDCSKSVINKERACDLCIMRCSNPHEQKKKKQILTTLETLCAYLIYRRNAKMNELQALKSVANQNSQDLIRELQVQDRTINELQVQSRSLKEQKEALQKQLQQIRESNSQIEESISSIQREIGQEGENFS